MKFHKISTSIGSLGKSDFYDFTFSAEQLEEAKKRDDVQPLLIPNLDNVIALFTKNGKLQVKYFTSYYHFEEGIGEHIAKEFDNCVMCSCGKKFSQCKKKLGMEKFQKHLIKLQEMTDESKRPI